MGESRHQTPWSRPPVPDDQPIPNFHPTSNESILSVIPISPFPVVEESPTLRNLSPKTSKVPLLGVLERGNDARLWDLVIEEV